MASLVLASLPPVNDICDKGFGVCVCVCVWGGGGILDILVPLNHNWQQMFSLP